MKIFNSRSRGVTLIELSIVLAILGVLIVATISGESLIDISRATATMQQLRDRSLAFQIFSSTYDCIPGDCIDATAKITGVAVNANGNGNASLNLASASTNNEVAFVEHHLVQARLFNRTIGTVTVGAQTGTQNALQSFLPKSKIPSTYISNISSSNLFYNIVGGLSTTNATTLAKKTKTGSRQETFAKQLVAIWQAFTPQETWTICHKLLPTSVADGG
jgi:prepilin-type N-terminal cleavage/methylation domain-containing protein